VRGYASEEGCREGTSCGALQVGNGSSLSVESMMNSGLCDDSGCSKEAARLVRMT